MFDGNTPHTLKAWMWPPVFSEILSQAHSAICGRWKRGKSRDQELRGGRDQEGLAVLMLLASWKEGLKSQPHCWHIMAPPTRQSGLWTLIAIVLGGGGSEEGVGWWGEEWGEGQEYPSLQQLDCGPWAWKSVSRVIILLYRNKFVHWKLN